MGGCASKPKDLDTVDKAPAPVEAPPATDKADVETAAQEMKGGDETKDKPAVAVVEAPEQAPESENTEEVKTEAKPEADVAKNKAEEQVNETPKEEKDVAETVATA